MYATPFAHLRIVTLDLPILLLLLLLIIIIIIKVRVFSAHVEFFPTSSSHHLRQATSPYPVSSWVGRCWSSCNVRRKWKFQFFPPCEIISPALSICTVVPLESWQILVARSSMNVARPRIDSAFCPLSVFVFLCDPQSQQPWFSYKIFNSWFF